MFMDIIYFIIVGLVVGALARLFIPGKQGISLAATIIIGIVAALLGGFITRQLMDVKDDGGVPWIPLIVSVVLAALFVGIYTRVQAGRVGRTLPKDGLSGSGRAH